MFTPATLAWIAPGRNRVRNLGLPRGLPRGRTPLPTRRAPRHAAGNPAASLDTPEEPSAMTNAVTRRAAMLGAAAKQTAEMLFEEINKAGGIGGIPVKAFFVDEAPGTDHLVGEYRRLVQN